MPKFGISKDQFEILDRIIEKYKSITKVIIFGSRAKNTHKQYSDIDLCLVGNISESQLAEINSDIMESNLIYTVDVVVFENITNQKLKQNIQMDGQVFWERVGYTKSNTNLQSKLPPTFQVDP